MTLRQASDERPWWHREGDPLNKRFAMDDDVSVERFCEEESGVFAELREIVRRELGHVRESHLVRLNVEIQFCY